MDQTRSGHVGADWVMGQTRSGQVGADLVMGQTRSGQVRSYHARSAKIIYIIHTRTFIGN